MNISVVDQYFGTDPDLDLGCQDADFFVYFISKLHLQKSSKRKSHKSHKTVEIKVFLAL